MFYKMRDWQTDVSSVFFIATALVIAYALIQVMMFPFWLRSSSKASQASDLQEFRTITLEPLEGYQKDFSTHALFSKPKAVVAVQPLGINELLKSYSLMGIIHGGESEALIQNITTKQTYYVREGETFDKFQLL